MAATFAAVGSPVQKIVGAQRKTVTDMTFDSSYLTGGEAFTAGNLNLTYIDHAEAQIRVPGNATDTLVSAKVDLTNSQGGFVELWDATPAEITSGDNVSTTIVRVIAHGW